MEGVFPSNKVPGGMRVGEVAVDPLAAGVLAMGESSEGPIQSLASSSSLTTLRICVADWVDELPGSNAWVPRGWVPGIKACILAMVSLHRL